MRRAFSLGQRWARYPLLSVLVLVAPASRAQPPSVNAPNSDETPPPSSETPPTDPMRRIGSISIGKPNAGYLINGVRMPEGKEWIVGVPDHAWGTDETIEALVHCIKKVHDEIPDTPPVILGSISAEHGGPVPPHKSHRTGRDVDIHFFLTKRSPNKWYEDATADNLDRRRTWALIRTITTDTDVEMILIDQSVQDLLEEYALGIGEDPTWIEELFHDVRPYSALIRHVPGHTGHMHVRFVSPYSRRRGVELYDQLVEQGHIEPPSREVAHIVEKGDTLIGIAKRNGTTVAAIQKANDLESTVIKIGQKLTLRERRDVPGARDRVVVPPRRLPPQGTNGDATAERSRDEAPQAPTEAKPPTKQRAKPRATGRSSG
jgi:LysM repeat protein/murein endopeptidase